MAVFTAVMRLPDGTETSSGTPANTASLMSMTNRGGSLIGKVVKLGLRVPTISTVPPFTETFWMVLTPGSAARALAPTRTQKASSSQRAVPHEEAMLQAPPRPGQKGPAHTDTYVCSLGREGPRVRCVRAYSTRFLMS